MCALGRNTRGRTPNRIQKPYNANDINSFRPRRHKGSEPYCLGLGAHSSYKSGLEWDCLAAVGSYPKFPTNVGTTWTAPVAKQPVGKTVTALPHTIQAQPTPVRLQTPVRNEMRYIFIPLTLYTCLENVILNQPKAKPAT